MMDVSYPMVFLRMIALLRARSVIDAIALASVPLAAILIGATVVLS
ncbi:MAG TPA: hypothetical protein VII68_19105 [Casimicrobiaceae bacterium]